MCSICLETSQGKLISTYCKHIFHLNCLSEYIIYQFPGHRYITVKCPICRNSIYIKHIINSYIIKLYDNIKYIKKRINKINRLIYKYTYISFRNIFNKENYTICKKGIKELKQLLYKYKKKIYTYKSRFTTAACLRNYIY